MASELDQAAADCEQQADRLEVAARHLRTAAAHFRAAEVPRACAHLLATQGELSQVSRALTARAETHAAHSTPDR